MKAFSLVQIDFNNEENRDQISEKELGIFVDETPFTAFKKVNDFLWKYSFKTYLGADNLVYPKFRVDVKELI